MKKYDWKNEYNPIRRTAKRLLSGEPLSDGRPLSELIELDEHARKCLAFEATLTDRQIDMLQELGYLPVITRQYGKECANCPYTLDEREHGICRRCAVFKKYGGRPCSTPKHRSTGQTPSVWKIFSAHRERRLSKADGNTAGKNMTA